MASQVYHTQQGTMYADTVAHSANDAILASPSAELLSTLTTVPIAAATAHANAVNLRHANNKNQ